MQHNFDMSAWLESFGILGGEVPEIVPVLQPVLVVNGESENVFPELAPTQNVGTFLAPGVFQSATLAVQALAAGGAFVDYISVTDAAHAPATFRWKITATDPGLNPLTGNTVFGTPVTACYSGVLASIGAPFMFARDNVTAFRPLYVPQGSFGIVQAQTNATAYLMGLRVRDVPAMEGGA